MLTAHELEQRMKTYLKKTWFPLIGHSRKSLIDAALSVDEGPTPKNASSSTDIKVSEDSSDTKKPKKRKNKESSPSPKKEPEEKTEDVFTWEVPKKMDTYFNGANAKSLEEENLQLKEQRLCKVIIKWIGLFLAFYAFNKKNLMSCAEDV